MRWSRPPCWPFLAVLALAGCDPKLTGTDGGDGGGNDRPDPVVTAEARIVGSILALHAEIFRAGLSVSAEFDTTAAATAFGRGVLADGCWSLTEASAVPPEWDLSLEGCTDPRGTTYRGGGEFDPVESIDGYAFFPWYDADLIRAINEADASCNHDLHSGSIEFTYERNGTAVTGMNVAKFLRHNVGSEIVTFTYDGTTFAGTHGSFAAYPDGTAQVVWDSVGVIGVEWQPGGDANYAMQGVRYQVDLATGSVTALAWI